MTQATYDFDVHSMGIRKLGSNETVSVNQRMLLVLCMALIALLFLLAAQPDSEAHTLYTLSSTIEQDPVSFAQTGLEESPDASSSPMKVQDLSPIFTDEVRYWERYILGWSKQFDLDPNLVAIIMQVESCGDPQAISIAGAQGLFQVMPFHFVEGEDSLDPDTNARRGISYFVGRLEQTGNDIGRSYAGYNGGHVAAASSWDNWAHETQRYYI